MSIISKLKNKAYPPLRRPGSCMHLHLTAKSEYEIYGRIVSESIQDHMKICDIRIANMAPPKPPSPPRPVAGTARTGACLTYGHMWQLDGTCANCAKVKGRR